MYLFDIFLLPLQKLRAHLDLDPAAFGPKLSLEKPGRGQERRKAFSSAYGETSWVAISENSCGTEKFNSYF